MIKFYRTYEYKISDKQSYFNKIDETFDRKKFIDVNSDNYYGEKFKIRMDNLPRSYRIFEREGSGSESSRRLFFWEEKVLELEEEKLSISRNLLFPAFTIPILVFFLFLQALILALIILAGGNAKFMSLVIFVMPFLICLVNFIYVKKAADDLDRLLITKDMELLNKSRLLKEGCDEEDYK